MENDNIFGELIHSYTRKQAIDDGVLVDLGAFSLDTGRPILELLGFKFPVAITCTAYARVIEDLAAGETQLPAFVINRRVLFFLVTLRRAITSPGDREDPTRINFSCTNSHFQAVQLKAMCGPGDTADPVITIMLPLED